MHYFRRTQTLLHPADNDSIKQITGGRGFLIGFDDSAFDQLDEPGVSRLIVHPQQRLGMTLPSPA